MAERVRVRGIDDDERKRLVRIVRRGTGSVVTWRPAQMVLLSAQGMDVAGIARVAFTSEDHVRDVIHNFNADGFDSLYPRYPGRVPAQVHPPAAPGDQEDRKSSPAEHGLPFRPADGEAQPREDEPQMVICVDELGPLNLQPRPGRQWAAIGGSAREPGRVPRPRLRARFNRTGGVRHLFAPATWAATKLHGHIKPRKTRTPRCATSRSTAPTA